jgi:hypothetical protein
MGQPQLVVRLWAVGPGTGTGLPVPAGHIELDLNQKRAFVLRGPPRSRVFTFRIDLSAPHFDSFLSP